MLSALMLDNSNLDLILYFYMINKSLTLQDKIFFCNLHMSVALID